MRIFRYWARASEPAEDGRRRWLVHRFAGSDTSVEDAERQAGDRARAAATAIANGDRLDRYGYADRPLREEVVKRSDDPGPGKGAWAITRNSYGSLILNTAHVLFADIDDPPAGGGGLVGRLFGRKPPEDPATAVVRRVEALMETHRGLGARLYRTAAGHRCLVTSRVHEPASKEAEALLRELGSDPLYVALCRAQSCFRARVSPKYWRCGAPAPPSRYPWTSDAEELAYREWETRYHDHADTHATCALVGTYGAADTHPAAAAVTAVHDDLACPRAAPLA